MRFSDMIEGLQILAKYEDKGLDMHLAGAEHDCVYAARADFDAYADGVDLDAYVEKHGDYPTWDDRRLSAEDNARLRELGWSIDADSGSWMHYA